MLSPWDSADMARHEKALRVLKAIGSAGGGSLDAAVRAACLEVSDEITGCGLTTQVAYLLRHGWSEDDIVLAANNPPV